MKHLCALFLLTLSLIVSAQVKDVTLTKTQLEEINTTFKNQYKNMKVVREGDTVLFSGEKTIIAVFDSEVGSWKMLEYLENSETYYNMFLPKEIAEYLGKS